MPSTTLIRTIGGVQDERVVMSNSHWARPHGVAVWSKLRIAFWISMRDGGATLTSSPIFAVGLSSGSANILGDLATTHFVGMKTTGTTMPYIPGPPPLYQLYPMESGKMIGATWTAAAVWLSTSGYIMADAPAGNRCCLLIDITKGSPNFTLNGYARINGTAGDIDEATFKAQSELNVATLTNHALGNSGTVAVDEATDGVLDHINVSWDRTTPEIEISAHGPFKLA
jgi:hypothetical protein